MSNKNKTTLKELHWKTDREQIENILHRLNPKYLLGRLEWHSKDRDYEQESEDHENNKKYVVPINYDGCTFTASKRTLEKECLRRVEEKTMIFLWRYATMEISF